MRSTARIIVAFIALGSASASVASAQAPSDPCAQITPAQVSAALGETVGAGQKINTVTCSWTADKPTHQIVTLSYSPPGDWNTLKTRPQPGTTKSGVSGIGDDAIAGTLANFTTLFVKKGSTTFMVKVYGVTDPAKQLAIEKPIAQAVVGKL